MSKESQVSGQKMLANKLVPPASFPTTVAERKEKRKKKQQNKITANVKKHRVTYI